MASLHQPPECVYMSAAQRFAAGESAQPMSTPVLKPSKPAVSFYEDDISTAAPSPWMGPDLESPWPSPMPGKRNRERVSFHLQLGSLMLPDMQPSVDFQGSDAFHEVPPASPCETPRKRKDTLASPSPVTPPAKCSQSCTPPPRAVAKMSDLMKALHYNALDQVRSVLSDDPEAAQQPMWEESMEPPLCAAARLSCSPEIIELLLDNGADVNAKDLAGQTPLMILRSNMRMCNFRVDILGNSQLATTHSRNRVEELLLAARAKTGILEDEPAPSRVFDRDANSSVWATLATAMPPPVSNLDLPALSSRHWGFFGEPIAV